MTATSKGKHPLDLCLFYCKCIHSGNIYIFHHIRNHTFCLRNNGVVTEKNPWSSVRSSSYWFFNQDSVRPSELFAENVRLKKQIEEMEMHGQRITDEPDAWPSSHGHFMKVKVLYLNEIN